MDPLNVCSCRFEQIRSPGPSGKNVEGGAQVAPGFGLWHSGPEKAGQLLPHVFFLVGGEIDEKGPRLVEKDKGLLPAVAEKLGRAEQSELKRRIGGGDQKALVSTCVPSLSLGKQESFRRILDDRASAGRGSRDGAAMREQSAAGPIAASLFYHVISESEVYKKSFFRI
jgi:hypothetical protein